MSEKRKVLMIATMQIHLWHFHQPEIKMLQSKGYIVHVAGRDNISEKGLSFDSADKIYNVPFTRSPTSFSNIKAYFELKKIIQQNNYSFISCHTPMGGLVGRLAANKARSAGTKVFYTAHGFHFYQGAPFFNWLTYYPIEKIFARLCTDVLVNITDEDYHLAKNRHFCENIYHIHGLGVNTEKCNPVDQQEKDRLRNQYGLNQRDYIILCTGDLNNNKNQLTVLQALSIVKENIPDVMLLLVGLGKNYNKLTNYISRTNMQNNVKFMGYQKDLANLVNLSDVVVSASFREGMPFNIMEAMQCKTPVIASKNRGHNELVQDGVSGYLFNPKDYQSLAKYIVELSHNRIKSTEFSEQGYRRIIPYRSDHVVDEIWEAYQKYHPAQ